MRRTCNLNHGHSTAGGPRRGRIARCAARAGLAVCLGMVPSCGSSPEHGATDERGVDGRGGAGSFIELFPHVRFDKGSRTVEFDARVAADCHQPTTPRVYLEATACTPDTREYESLVVTDALPSHVHAAMLLAGMIPGEPGRFAREGGRVRPIAARGESLRVAFVVIDASGTPVESSPLEWVVDIGTGGHLLAPPDGPAWVFGGSRIVEFDGGERYEADLTGTLIGLTSFGSETISFGRVMSPEASVQEPEWIADAARVPAVGTPVVVRIHAAGAGRQAVVRATRASDE